MKHQNCIYEESHSDITTGPALYSADSFFHGFNKITSPQLTEFKARRAVILEHRFEAASGSVFKVSMEGCL